MKCKLTGLRYWRIPRIMGLALKEIVPDKVLFQLLDDGTNGYFVFEKTLVETAYRWSQLALDEGMRKDMEQARNPAEEE